MAKTADGKFRLADIVQLALQIPGVSVEQGTRHPYVLKFCGAMAGNCALATSTDTDRHIVPWFKRVTGYNKQTIYDSLRAGSWA